MKRNISIITVLIFSLVMITAATAGDVEDIKKATLEHFATQNAGDAMAHIAHHMPSHSQFGGDGGLLIVSSTREEQVKGMQATYDAGVKFNLELRHLDVQVYGKAAVVTGYIEGTVTGPDGQIMPLRDRRTAVLIKDGNAWKEVHVHLSPVERADDN